MSNGRSCLSILLAAFTTFQFYSPCSADGHVAGSTNSGATGSDYASMERGRTDSSLTSREGMLNLAFIDRKPQGAKAMKREATQKQQRMLLESKSNSKQKPGKASLLAKKAVDLRMAQAKAEQAKKIAKAKAKKAQEIASKALAKAKARAKVKKPTKKRVWNTTTMIAFTSTHALATQRTRMATARIRHASARWLPLCLALCISVGSAQQTAKDVIWKLLQGNLQFIAHKDDHERKFNQGTLVDKLIENPYSKTQLKAIVLSDARSFASLDQVFNTDPGELLVVRVCGYVCGKHDPFDGVVGSIEFAFNQSAPPVLLVLGNSWNFVVESAVRLALVNSTRKVEVPPAAESEKRLDVQELDILQEVLPAAQDAILQDPHATFEELCDIAAKLNVWNTIETLLTTSVALYDAVEEGKLQIHGGFHDIASGKVHFMGEHPSKKDLMRQRPADDIVRTAKAPPVPAEEAFAVLYAGNKRYATGNGGNKIGYSEERHAQLSSSGQNPIAVILGCADSRAPPETLFDARPGDLFVLRTAGNTCDKGPNSILGSAEYAIGNLGTKLVVVMGHTKCGAVTAAVSAVRNNMSLDSFGGSIGRVLAPLTKEAAKAVAEAPETAIPEIVERATELNVFATMEKMIVHSKIVRDGVRHMDLQIHGAVYDIETGAVKWLGQHPHLESIVRMPLPVHQWKTTPYVRAACTFPKCIHNKEIARLSDGNKRFVAGKSQASNLERQHPTHPSPDYSPLAIVVSGTEMRVPVEIIFDTAPGEILVQRSTGPIAGHPSGTLFASLEYAVVRFQPKVLVVLAEMDSSVITAGLDYVYGAATSFGPTHIVLDRVAIPVLQTVLQADDDTSQFKTAKRASTSAGRDMRVRRLAVELHALYVVEQLLRRSKVIRNAVKSSQVELHVAILHEGTGEVEFIGPHPKQSDLLADVVIDHEADLEYERQANKCVELDPDADHAHDDHDHDHSSCSH